MKNLQFLFAALLAAFSASAAAVGNLADVAVFDRTDGRQLPVYSHEGRAYVIGKPGNEYSVRIRNRQREDVLGVVSVDGVNVITGETATAQQSGYVLSAYRMFDVSGWRKNLASTAAFYFTALPDSYAARTGRPDNVGVIGVALFKRKRAEPPADISLLSRQAPAASAAEGARDSARAEAQSRAFTEEQKLGTGHGRVESSQAQYVGFERESSTPQETVALYYDSYRNLVARGVIREPIAPCAIPCSPRFPQPRPFPGFVPDPPA